MNLSWIDGVIRSCEKYLEENKISPEKQKLLDDLNAVELYIASAPKAKARRALKQREIILEKISEW